jgi:ABC-2 type transport system permease protein
MRREGSPWQGLGTVFAKELADHVSSVRMLVLEILFLLIACVVVYFAIDQIRQTIPEDPFVLLKLFTVGRSSLLSLLTILGILIPLVAIGLGFDAVNGEHNRRTLSRILSQPIYRDALLAGKFLAALTTLAICLLCTWLLVVGLGIILLGVPPSGEEIARAVAFLLVTLAYAGIWLALAILLSIVFRSAATAALVALGIWLFLTLIWPMLAPAFANVISPPDIRYLLVGIPSPNTAAWERALMSISPNQLYGEAAAALLAPEARAVGTTDYIGYLNQLQGAIRGSVLPLNESLAIAWPQTVSLIAGVIVLFVAGYVVFQRQEVRA